MNIIAVDSDVCVDYLRSGAALAPLIAEIVNGSAVGHCSVVVHTELISGARTARSRREVNALLLTMLPISLTLEDAALAGQFLLDFKDRTGLRLGDALIAASSVNADLPLLTRNVRHFQGIPGLTLVEP